LTYIPSAIVVFLITPPWNMWSEGIHITIGLGLALWLALPVREFPEEFL
jgi:hypothetical protein